MFYVFYRKDSDINETCFYIESKTVLNSYHISLLTQLLDAYPELGQPIEEGSDKLLIEQIESPVRWRESIVYMINNNVKTFIEIGPGKVLSGMIKRIEKNINIININEFEDLKNLNDKF